MSNATDKLMLILKKKMIFGIRNTKPNPKSIHFLRDSENRQLQKFKGPDFSPPPEEIPSPKWYFAQFMDRTIFEYISEQIISQDKPHKLGIKIFSRASVSRTIRDFEIYTEKGTYQ